MSDARMNDAKILTELAVLGERVEAINTRTIRLVKLMEGNGDGPGLKTRVDRLEQDSKRQRGYHMAWFTALVAGAVAAVQGWFNGAP